MLKLRESVLIDGRYAVIEIEIDEKEIARVMASRVRQASQRKGRPVAASALWGAVRAQVLKPTVSKAVRPLDEPWPVKSSVECLNTGDAMCSLIDCTRCGPMRRVAAAHKQIQEAFESDDMGSLTITDPETFLNLKPGTYTLAGPAADEAIKQMNMNIKAKKAVRFVKGKD